MSYKVHIPVNTPESDVQGYLTIGKVYDAVERPEFGEGVLFIKTDDGETAIIRPEGCSHINWNAWEFIEDNEGGM